MAEGVEAIAVCLINAYANDTHERRIKGIIERLAPDLPHSISFDVLPEINEYHRTSTTVINTYINAVGDLDVEPLGTADNVLTTLLTAGVGVTFH